jgi:hypothetical protein
MLLLLGRLRAITTVISLLTTVIGGRKAGLGLNGTWDGCGGDGDGRIPRAWLATRGPKSLLSRRLFHAHGHEGSLMLLLCTLAIAQTLAVTPTPAGALDDPRVVVRESNASVENDGVAGVRALWQARLCARLHGPGSLLGLATLSRLTYDYPNAEALYRRLSEPTSSRGDGFAIYAVLARPGHSRSAGSATAPKRSSKLSGRRRRRRATEARRRRR